MLRKAPFMLIGTCLVSSCASGSPSDLSAGQQDIPAAAGTLGLDSPTGNGPYVGPRPPSAVVQLALGGHMSFALLHDGTVMAWGGAASPLSDWIWPPARVAGLDHIVYLAAGGSHACAVRADRTLICWGSNPFGELGNGSANGGDDWSWIPPGKVPGLTDVLSVACGMAHTCALRVDGTVWCWGEGSGGAIGNGSLSDVYVPTKVVGIKTAVEIEAGPHFTCARLDDGSASCWDPEAVLQNLGGYVGLASQLFPPSTVVELAATMGGVCGRYGDDSLRCLGAFPFLVEPGKSDTPIPLPGIASASRIVAQHYNNCTLSKDGAVQCWGNYNFSIHLNSTDFHASPEHPWIPISAKVTQIAVGTEHGCAIMDNGTVQCWGSNGYHELGDGTDQDSMDARTVLWAQPPPK